MTATTTDRCAHELCKCAKPYDKHDQAMGTRYVDPNATYCSARCEEMVTKGLDRLDDDGCECGHTACTSAPTPDIPPMQ